MDPLDREYLIRTIVGEAANEPIEGMAGVAHVIMNRTKAGRYGGTSIKDVVRSPKQFEPWDTRADELMALSPRSPAYRKAAAVADAVVDGRLRDPTNGATHFLNEAIVRGRRGGDLPKWARGQGQTIGNHAFHAPEGRVMPAAEQKVAAMPEKKRVKVTDPALLEKLNGTTKKRIKVTDPAILAKLNGTAEAATDQEQPADERNSIGGKIDAVGRGVADMLSFGFADEIAAGGDALLNPVLGTGNEGESFSDRYDANLAQQRGIDESDNENRFGYRLGGQIAGGVGGGIGLARSGLSAATQLAQKGKGLGAVSVGSAVDGAALGAGHGLGTGEGIDGRVSEAMNEGLLGGLGGAVAPGIIAGGSAALRPVINALRPSLTTASTSNNALNEMMKRSGLTPDEIGNALAAAAEDGQRVFTMADAVGNPAQRMLSTVARTPHNERANVTNFLAARQSGQGRRITNALAEGFEAPDTAAQRVNSLTTARNTAADANYGAAREQAGAVDVTGAIDALDAVLRPGVNKLAAPSNLLDDSVEKALTKARGLLTDGKSNMSDFEAVHRIKQDLDDMVNEAVRGGKGNLARLLNVAVRRLDDSLAQASPPYASARDTYAQGSRAIEAVDTGKNAALRGRSEDTIPAFQKMSPDEQSGFRAGYADKLITDAQGGAPGVNKARPLINDAMAEELPAFAAPGKGDRMVRQIGREQTMAETNAAALGGSRTADNMADAIDSVGIDPSAVQSLIRGRFFEALSTVAMKGAARVTGKSPAYMENMARALLETDPDKARTILEAALNSPQVSAVQRSAIVGALNNLNSGVRPRVLGEAKRQPLELTVTRPANR